MEHADGDAPIQGAPQPDLVEGEDVKYIKHGVSVFIEDRCSPAYFLPSSLVNCTKRAGSPCAAYLCQYHRGRVA
jgi:hypothetical protein